MNASAPIAAPLASPLQLDFSDDSSLVDLVTHPIGRDRREVELEVPDMHCANCAARIEQALTGIDGVDAVRVNPARHLVSLDYDPTRTPLGALLDALTEIGYTPAFLARASDDPRLLAERRDQLKRLGVAGLAMMQIMMFALPLYVADRDGLTPFYATLFRWSSLVFALPVVFYSARPFFANAARSVGGRRSAARETGVAIGRGLAMDVPVALAIAIAFGASLVATVAGRGDVYYDSIAMFTFLLLGARVLEQRTRHRLARFDDWLALLPASIDRLRDGRIERVAIGALSRGDRVLVPAGSRLPVDGTIEEGESRVDESVLTGESQPIGKPTGARVYAGTLNVDHPVTVAVDAPAVATRMADIHRLAQRAALDKPQLAILADRAARHFVVAIVAIAAVTCAAWLAFDPARALPATLAVLVVSCPCALSLATPMALTAAAIALRRHGFVITRANVLEQLARVTRVVFDKTGTLTGGAVELVHTAAHADRDVDACIAIARALDLRTTHPLARALGSGAGSGARAVRVERGKGLEGVVDAVAYRLGNADYCGATAPPARPELSTFYLSRVEAGDRTVLAEFGVRAQLRVDAPLAIDALRQLGVGVEILSGDGAEPTRLVSHALGDVPFRSRVAPEAKLERLKALRAEGEVVAMVADGINDVPSLSGAAVSIATADGTDLAKSAADALLLGNGVGAVPRAIAIARRARGVIRQNIGWAFAYNAIAIPFAALGSIPPWLAALGMSGSSLLVASNAVRLIGRRAEGA